MAMGEKNSVKEGRKENARGSEWSGRENECEREELEGDGERRVLTVIKVDGEKERRWERM